MKWTHRRIAMAATLFVIGVVLLIGCIPIPATWQEQSDGRPRPERAIGKRTDDPVRLGYTHIEDAIMQLTRRVGGPPAFSGWLPVAMAPAVHGPWRISQWSVSPNRRQFALYYSLRTGIQVWPLCFSITQDTESRWLTLQLDDRGVVVGTKTSNQPPFPPTTPPEWLRIFDEPTRRRLQYAGILPSDATLQG